MPKTTLVWGEYSQLYRRDLIDSNTLVTEVGGWSVIATHRAIWEDDVVKRQEHAAEVWTLVGELVKQALHLDPVLPVTVRNQIADAIALSDENNCHTGCAPDTEAMAQAVLDRLFGDRASWS